MYYYETYLSKLTFVNRLSYLFSPKARKAFKAENERIENLIKVNYEVFRQIAVDEADKNYKNAAQSTKDYNSKCGRCNNKDNVVDKITQVKGSGKISGDFSLGFGAISGDSSLDTLAVNHCNVCGHQWEKREVKYSGTMDECKSLLWAVEVYFLKEADWRKSQVDALKNKGVSAETLYHAIHEEKCLEEHDSAFKALTLKILREHFVSILK